MTVTAVPVLTMTGYVLLPPAAAGADNDISTFDGTACSSGQFYNATTGQCEASTAASGSTNPAGMSTFDGTACTGREFYNASARECDVASVIGTTGPPMDLAGLAADVVSLSDPGARCASTELYSVAHAMCWPETITNDPRVTGSG